MNFSIGEIMFYGGAVGMIVVAIAGIITAAVLAGGRKKLRRRFENETIKNHK